MVEKFGKATEEGERGVDTVSLRGWMLFLGPTVLELCACSANISDFCAVVQLIRLTTKREQHGSLEVGCAERLEFRLLLG